MVEDFEIKVKFFFISCFALLNVNGNQIHRQKRELDGLFLAAGTFIVPDKERGRSTLKCRNTPLIEA